MIQIVMLFPEGTSTSPGVLHFRTFNQVEGWTHGEWGPWRPVPNVSRLPDSVEPPKADAPANSFENATWIEP